MVAPSQSLLISSAQATFPLVISQSSNKQRAPVKEMLGFNSNFLTRSRLLIVSQYILNREHIESYELCMRMLLAVIFAYFTTPCLESIIYNNIRLKFFYVLINLPFNRMKLCLQLAHQKRRKKHKPCKI